MNLCIMKIDTIMGSYKCFKKRPLINTQTRGITSLALLNW
ncbi:hypothetical protein EZS27_021691 [termite gut metagenome]|uniref:Uncharacterized protein n=1 Tax=termite gut metagenome TaxID=433724 RepID=A0A5J4R969_9ZZZZ